MKVTIDNAFGTAMAATLGVLVACSLVLLVAGWLLDADIDSEQVRTICAQHDGVDRVDEGTTFMDGSTFVFCRDGWFERADN